MYDWSLSLSLTLETNVMNNMQILAADRLFELRDAWEDNATLSNQLQDLEVCNLLHLIAVFGISLPCLLLFPMVSF